MPASRNGLTCFPLDYPFSLQINPQQICKHKPYLQKALPVVCLEEHLLSSSIFHKGIWTFSILHNTGASHITRKDFLMLVSAAQFQLFKPSVPLGFFAQTNPIQSYLHLFHRLHIFILADTCTSVPATKYQSLTHLPCSAEPLSKSQTLASFTLLHDVPGKH